MTTSAAAIAPTEARRRATHRRWHRDCFACGEGAGLNLRFRVTPDGGVAAEWDCPAHYQSYEGILHGGLTATLLDCAMVHALFAHGIVAHTAELNLRYRHPVSTGIPVIVSAHLRARCGVLCVLAAEVRQRGNVCTTAQAKFMARQTGDPVAGESTNQQQPTKGTIHESVSNCRPTSLAGP
jgi:acyl-coenzyme A thioesterase PaaI-like protein